MKKVSLEGALCLMGFKALEEVVNEIVNDSDFIMNILIVTIIPFFFLFHSDYMTYPS